MTSFPLMNTIVETKQEVNVPNLIPQLFKNRYQYRRILGRGTFAQMIEVWDTKTCTCKALKLLNGQYKRVGSREAITIDYLNKFDSDNNSNIIRMCDFFEQNEYFCIVLELYGQPLLNYLQRKKHLSLSQTRKIAMQLFVSLSFLKQRQVIHADLKPENILMQYDSNINYDKSRKGSNPNNCSVKVIDFGNAMSYGDLTNAYKHYEVQSLYYRSPEIMAGIPFNWQIDLWSVGAILIELILGYPVFKSKDRQTLCDSIYNFIGPYPEYLYRFCKFYNELPFNSNHQKYFTNCKDIAKLDDMRKKRIRNAIIQEHPNILITKEWEYFIDLISKLLDPNPQMRWTSDEAIFHPFMNQLIPLNFFNFLANDTRLPDTLSHQKRQKQLDKQILKHKKLEKKRLRENINISKRNNKSIRNNNRQNSNNINGVIITKPTIKTEVHSHRYDTNNNNNDITYNNNAHHNRVKQEDIKNILNKNNINSNSNKTPHMNTNITEYSISLFNKNNMHSNKNIQSNNNINNNINNNKNNNNNNNNNIQHPKQTHTTYNNYNYNIHYYNTDMTGMIVPPPLPWCPNPRPIIKINNVNTIKNNNNNHNNNHNNINGSSLLKRNGNHVSAIQPPNKKVKR